MTYNLNVTRDKIEIKKGAIFMKRSILALFLLTLAAMAANAQNSTLSETDRDAIKATALDYIEGW